MERAELHAVGLVVLPARGPPRLHQRARQLRRVAVRIGLRLRVVSSGRSRLAAVLHRTMVLHWALRLDLDWLGTMGLAHAPLRPLGLLGYALVLDSRTTLGASVGHVGVVSRIRRVVPGRVRRRPPGQRRRQVPDLARLVRRALPDIRDSHRLRAARSGAVQPGERTICRSRRLPDSSRSPSEYELRAPNIRAAAAYGAAPSGLWRWPGAPDARPGATRLARAACGGCAAAVVARARTAPPVARRAGDDRANGAAPALRAVRRAQIPLENAAAERHAL